MVKEFNKNNFDLLRLLAATQVLILHSISHLDVEGAGYWTVYVQKFPGVPIFFVLSGYLISSSFERTRDVKNYFRNRALRIYPGLWGCLLATIITASIFGGINFLNKQMIIWLFAQMIGLIYTPGPFKDYGFGSYNGALWTIMVELQFYLILPAAYFIMRRIIKFKYFFTGLWLIFILIAFLIKLYFPAMDTANAGAVEKLISYSFLPHFYLFLTGVVLQRAKVYLSDWVYGKGLIWLVAYILFSLIVPYTGVLSLIHMIFLGFVSITLAYTFPSFSHRAFRGNDISYGVYLYHGIILNVFVERSVLGKLAYVWYILLISYILAFISWKLIEKPFMKKKVKTIHKIDE